MADRGSKGSVYAYQTQSGTRYRLVFRDARGKQTSRNGFRSRASARKERERLMGKVHRGEVRVSRESLAGFWHRYLQQRKPYLESGSWQDYRRHGELRILPHLGHRKLTALSAPELREWLVELSESGTWAPKTLNNALKALVVCLNYAVADGLIAANPASYVQALPLGHIERDYLRLSEITPYLDACSDVYRPLAQTLIGTGMRISEALALTVADVDVDRRAIVVARSLKDDGRVGSTKSDRFRRVEIGPELAATLADHAAQRMEETPDAGHHALLFVMPVRRGKREKGRWRSDRDLSAIDRGTVSRAWHKQALQDAGLRDMPLHSLRHTAAAAWLSTGRPLMYVQRQLGHAQITTTERLYGHLEEAFARAAAADTEALIRQAGQNARCGTLLAVPPCLPDEVHTSWMS
jgi:integrase